MNDHIRSCKCFSCDIEKTLQYVPPSTPLIYTCNECDYEGQHRGAFEQCWLDNHTISERPISLKLDEVNSPVHYNQGSVECIDAIQAALSAEEWRGFLKGQILKYTWRERHKGGKNDILKADFYLNKLKEVENES